MDPEHFSTVRNHALLATLDAGQLARIAQRCQLAELVAGQMLFQRGSEARHFYLVLEGQIKLCLQSRSGVEKIIDLLGPGRAFAEALMFDEIPIYPVAAIAVERSRLIAVPNADYHAMLRDDSTTCLRLLADLSRRLHSLVHEIEVLAFENATNRLVNHILAQAAVTSGPATVLLRESKQALAARLSIQPETLSRTLRALSESGLIQVDGRAIHVLDTARLRETPYTSQ